MIQNPKEWMFLKSTILTHTRVKTPKWKYDLKMIKGKILEVCITTGRVSEVFNDQTNLTGRKNKRKKS